jgi:dTDP-4-dehydrorhamnose 3,5-epimerase-like enzyme
MNIALDLPDEVASLVESQPDKRGFVIEAIQREWSRRNAVAQLLQLSERVSFRNKAMTEAQLEELLRD